MTDAVPGVLEATKEKTRGIDGTKSINGFKVHPESIGSGSFSVVKRCEETSTGKMFAIKIFRKGKLRRERHFVGGNGEGMRMRSSLDKVYNEVNMLKRVSHPHCIRVRGIFDDEDKDGKLYLVVELAKGALMEWDVDRCTYYVPATGGLIAEGAARIWTRHMLEGLAYLHGISVAHRDVKPQNLLIAVNRVLLADFSVAIDIGADGLVHGTEGTYCFYSPEMTSTTTPYEGHDVRKADVWAAGVSLWAFVFGSVPFYTGENLLGLFEAISTGEYVIPARPEVSEDCLFVIRRMLERDARRRPHAREFFDISWFSREASGLEHGNC